MADTQAGRKFKPGDRVDWTRIYKVSNVTERWRRVFGDGPYTVKSVEVDATDNPLITIKPNKRPPPGEDLTFTESWFDKVGAT